MKAPDSELVTGHSVEKVPPPDLGVIVEQVLHLTPEEKKELLVVLMSDLGAVECEINPFSEERAVVILKFLHPSGGNIRCSTSVKRWRRSS